LLVALERLRLLERTARTTHGHIREALAHAAPVGAASPA
jgi:hypothetical protein